MLIFPSPVARRTSLYREPPSSFHPLRGSFTRESPITGFNLSDHTGRQASRYQFTRLESRWAGILARGDNAPRLSAEQASLFETGVTAIGDKRCQPLREDHPLCASVHVGAYR